MSDVGPSRYLRQGIDGAETILAPEVTHERVIFRCGHHRSLRKAAFLRGLHIVSLSEHFKPTICEAFTGMVNSEDWLVTAVDFARPNVRGDVMEVRRRNISAF